MQLPSAVLLINLMNIFPIEVVFKSLCAEILHRCGIRVMEELLLSEIFVLSFNVVAHLVLLFSREANDALLLSNMERRMDASNVCKAFVRFATAFIFALAQKLRTRLLCNHLWAFPLK